MEGRFETFSHVVEDDALLVVCYCAVCLGVLAWLWGNRGRTWVEGCVGDEWPVQDYHGVMVCEFQPGFLALEDGGERVVGLVYREGVVNGDTPLLQVLPVFFCECETVIERKRLDGVELEQDLLELSRKAWEVSDSPGWMGGLTWRGIRSLPLESGSVVASPCLPKSPRRLLMQAVPVDFSVGLRGRGIGDIPDQSAHPG